MSYFLFYDLNPWALNHHAVLEAKHVPKYLAGMLLL